MLSMGLSLGLVKRGGVSDPDFASTKLLLGFEGVDGSTTFPDESAAARGNATVFGAAQVDTAQFKFGAASGLFNGSSSYLTFADSADWDFGNGAWTLECFVRHNSLPATFHYLGNFDSTNGWRMRYSAGQLAFNSSATGNAVYAWVPPIGQWFHIAADRVAAGGKTRLYLDGVMVDSTTGSGSIADSALALHIGRYAASGIQYFDGWMDELRITKGVARYASDSGFTVPTAAYPRF
jgi:hypothetical protein